MKVALVITKSEEARRGYGPSELEFEGLVEWWADLQRRGNVIASVRLAPSSGPRTVSWRDQAPVVTDGPFVEAKETVGGMIVLEVESEAEAVEIAKSLLDPRTGCRIEIRLVEHATVHGDV